MGALQKLPPSFFRILLLFICWIWYNKQEYDQNKEWIAMGVLSGIEPERVFGFFEEISAVPRGSGDMERISKYCEDFALERGLKYVRDEAGNVIIYKDASEGYENSEPVILQGHLDMVCQKNDGIGIDFKKDGISLAVDGGYIRAEGTTLGADNGIAAAMMLAILDGSYAHPPLEAVFTVDEEIGMLGAAALDTRALKARRMINLDSEEIDTVTVSCAGGSDLVMRIPFKREVIGGARIAAAVRGLRGGHSGVEINSGCVNADMLMGRLLSAAARSSDLGIIAINGGDKGNAIPNACRAEIAVPDAEKTAAALKREAEIIKAEIAAREPGFEFDIEALGSGEHEVIDSASCKKLIFALMCAPNGVMQMSADIDGLVETSLNLGILKTDDESIALHFTLRSNKQSALEYLERRLRAFAEYSGLEAEAFGHYLPWEYAEGSELLERYVRIYTEKTGEPPQIAALHAGLECGTFAAKIDGLECISIGPQMYDVHTTAERLDTGSVKVLFEMLLELLKECR